VNAFFMCDYGRLNYRWMNRRDRAEKALVRAKGSLVAAQWDVAIQAAARMMSGKRAFVVASPMLSNESLFLLRQIVDDTSGTGVFRVAQGDEAPLPGVKDLALRKDRAANVHGAERIGFRRASNVFDGLKNSDVLLIAGEDLDGIDASALGDAGEILIIGPTLPAWLEEKAAIVLPTTNFSEEEGTVTNLRGRVQRFAQAKTAPGEARPTWLVLGDLRGAMGKQASFFLPSEVFAKLASTNAAFSGLTYDRLGYKGLPVVDARAGAAS